MTVVIWPCGWPRPHAPHVFLVVHPDAPSFVNHLSCPGQPVPVPKKDEDDDEDTYGRPGAQGMG